ncbi:MAG: argininosuccinate lyase [Halanaerobiales bacterium]|nr:argininosuccinate lyase [Halanaerobiales bacterium]
MKLWSGRFSDKTHETVDQFTASIPFDQRLYQYDIMGSMAHVKMLAHVGIISEKEKNEILQGLTEVLQEIESGEYKFQLELEDIHMNIEHRLTEKIGSVGGKVHTARSRNDQVALDIRLFLRDEINCISEIVRDLQNVLINLAENHCDLIMPGYTHLQRAQPILLSHHLLAYFEMFERDNARLIDCLKRVNLLPLGSGALAGTTFPIDRSFVQKELGFDDLCHNSIDGVSDRDFIIEFQSTASLIMMHLSRFSEEIILWASQEFSFIELADAYCTGSSIMPQKKNPDIAELVRGKTGRVYGNLLQILTVLKGLPLAYNKDMQEDKESLFDTVDTLKMSLYLFTQMLATSTFNYEKMRNGAQEGFLNATDAADYLVKKGLPFREAHEIIGEMVLKCIKTGKNLEDLTLKEWQELKPLFEEDIYEKISVEYIVNQRNSYGGTAKQQVLKQIVFAKARVGI